MSNIAEVAFDLLKIVCKRDHLRKFLKSEPEDEEMILKYQKYIEDSCKENNFTVDVVEKYIYTRLLIDEEKNLY